MRDTKNSKEDPKDPNVTIVIGLVGSGDEKHKIEALRQTEITLSMLYNFGKMPIRGSGRKESKITGLEEVPIPENKREMKVCSLNYELQFESLKLEEGIECDTISFHFCDHHTTKGGLRAGKDKQGKDLFYDIEGIADVLVKEILLKIEFKQVNVVFHACKTSTRSSPDVFDSTIDKFLSALCLKLQQCEQNSLVTVYGVPYKITESGGRRPPAYTLTDDEGKQIKSETGFEAVSGLSVTAGGPAGSAVSPQLARKVEKLRDQ